MSSSKLLTLICELECQLHQADIRQNLSRLNELIHPDFQELSRSGKTYNKAETISYLAQAQSNSSIQSWNFKLVQLKADVAILTYESAIKDESGRFQYQTLRSSIWILSSVGWQIVFHQGTPSEIQ